MRGKSRFRLTEMTRFAKVANDTGAEIRLEAPGGEVVRILPASRSPLIPKVVDGDAKPLEPGKLLVF